MKSILITSTIFLSLFFSSCSSSPKKSPLQLEAEQKAQEWFDNSFAQCDDSFITRYDGSQIQVGQRVMFMEKGYLQFKNINYIIEEKPLSDADKLNGIEWKGYVTLLPIKPTVRYYDESSASSKQWSKWQEEVIFYSPDLFLPSMSKKGSPTVRELKKVKGSWESLGQKYMGGNDFVKPQCSEIPKS
jgi:hypothetical protein